MGMYIDLGVLQGRTIMVFQYKIHVCVYMDDMVVIINGNLRKQMSILYDVLLFLKKLECRSREQI